MRLAGCEGVLLVIVQNLVLDILVNLDVAGETDKVAARGRIVVECYLDASAAIYHGQVLGHDHVRDAVAVADGRCARRSSDRSVGGRHRSAGSDGSAGRAAHRRAGGRRRGSCGIDLTVGPAVTLLVTE